MEQTSYPEEKDTKGNSTSLSIPKIDTNHWWFSFLKPTWSNTSRGYFDYQIDGSDSLLSPNWQQTEEFTPDWSIETGKVALYWDNPQPPEMLKYLSDKLTYYFYRTGVEYLLQNDKYRVTYEMDIYNSIFYFWLKALKDKDLEIYFRKKMMNRTLVDEDGNNYLSFLQQWWYRNNVPLDIPLNKNQQISITNDLFSTYPANTNPQEWEFLSLTSGDSGDKYKTPNFWTDYIISETIDYLDLWLDEYEINISSINKDIYTYLPDPDNRILIISCQINQNIYAETMYHAPDYFREYPLPDPYFNETPPGEWKILVRLDDSIASPDITPVGRWNYQFTKNFLDATFLVDVYENNKLLSWATTAKIIQLTDYTFGGVPWQKRLINGYFIAVRNDSKKAWGKGWGYKQNIKVISQFEEYLPIKINPAIKDHITVDKKYLQGSKFFNKTKYVIISDKAMNSQKFNSSEAYSGVKILGAYFITPIMNDFGYKLQGTGDEIKVDAEKYYYALFKRAQVDSEQPNKNDDLIIADDNIQTFETSLPIEIFSSYMKVKFENYADSTGEGDPLPIISFYVPSVDFTNIKKLITLYEQEIPFSFDLRTWDQTNEPHLFSRQFFQVFFNQTANEIFNVPTDLFVYNEFSSVCSWNFFLSVDTNVNLILDINNFDPNFAKAMSNDNFIFRLTQPWTFETTAYNNWVQSNMTTEYTERKNFADQKTIDKWNYGQSVVNNAIGGLFGGGQSIAMGGMKVAGAGEDDLLGAAAGLGFAGVGAVVGLAKGIGNSIIDYQQMQRQWAIQQRSIDSKYTNLRLSPNSLSVSPYQATNMFANPTYFINITTPFPKQIPQIMLYLYLNGETVNSTFHINDYDNRLLYNVMEIDTIINREAIDTTIKDCNYCPFVNTPEMRNTFFIWLEQLHGFYKTNTMDIDHTKNVERFWYALYLEGDTTDWYLQNNIEEIRYIEIKIWGEDFDKDSINVVIGRIDGSSEPINGFSYAFDPNELIITMKCTPDMDYPLSGIPIQIYVSAQDPNERTIFKEIIYSLFTNNDVPYASLAEFDSDNYLAANGLSAIDGVYYAA